MVSWHVESVSVVCEVAEDIRIDEGYELVLNYATNHRHVNSLLIFMVPRAYHVGYLRSNVLHCIHEVIAILWHKTVRREYTSYNYTNKLIEATSCIR